MSEKNSLPKISIVIPSYNQGVFIEETIKSVLFQTYPNLELTIIDGGSTDSSVEVIRKYKSSLSYWVSEPDRGQSHAVNKGIRQATGEIVLWLNADDLCLPGSFRVVADAFRTNPAVKMVTGQAQVVDADGKVTGELLSHFTSWEDMVTNPRNVLRQVSTFFSRELFDELGFLDESLDVAMDTELLIRFVQRYRPVIVSEYLSAYRVHADAKSIRQRIKGYAESDRMRVKYFPNKQMAGLYRNRSAEKWLQMSRSAELTMGGRATCLFHAVRNQPSIILARRFGSSVKKLFTERVPWAVNERQPGD